LIDLTSTRSILMTRLRLMNRTGPIWQSTCLWKMGGQWSSQSAMRDHYAGGAAQFFEADPARGPAHWLMVCRIESAVVTIPLVPAKTGDPSKCRPIGLFETTGTDRLAYLENEYQ
jgi:hypothetical protein